MKLPNHLFPGLLSFKGVVPPSLSRNFFTALRKPSFDKPKPRFASSISHSANWFSSALVRTGEGPFRRSKFTLPFSLSCRVDLFSSHFCAAFQVLIPPYFTSFIRFRNFSDRCSAILQSQQRDLYENSWFKNYRFRLWSFYEMQSCETNKIFRLDKCVIKIAKRS